MTNHVLMVGSEESMPSGQSDRHGEREDESEGPDSSCRRTTPSQALARPSCARAYISWPFSQRGSSTKVWNVSATGAPASGPSANTVSSGTLSDSPVPGSSVTDTTVSRNATLCCEMKDDDRGIQAGTEHVRTSETNGSISEKSPRLVNGSIESDQITFELGHRGPTIEAAELQRGPISCSLEAGHPSDVVLEQGVSRVEKVESQAREPDILWRQESQQFRNPLKKYSSSGDQVENPTSPYPPALSRPLNGIMEPSLFQSTWERHSTPAGLAQAGHLSAVSETQNLRALLKVSTAFPQGCSEDDASSVSSSDELVDEALAPCGEIMCEIQDAYAGPCQERSCHGPAHEEEGPSREAIDLLKAYEQDAIVLDVIQDDPELFGIISEERMVAAVVKSETPLVSRAFRPVKMPAVQTNHRITWNSEISATGNDDIGQHDLKKEGRSILPFLTDGNWENLCFDGERPLLNGRAGNGFHMDGSLPSQKGTTDSTQDSVSDWLWTEFDTSVQGDACLNSAKASTSDETSDEGLEGDTMQANKIKDPSRQSVPWAAGSFRDQSENCEKYCKFYFSERHCCFRKECWFRHLPREGDERFCMDAVQRLCSVEKLSHLQRAAAVFTGYYEKCPPGVHFASHVLKSLLSALLSQDDVKDLLSVLRVMTPYKILPPVEFILVVYEHVSWWGLYLAIPDLIDVTAKSVEAGLVLSVENFEYMQRRLELLVTPRDQMDLFLSVKHRVLETPVTLKPEVGELATALAEVECCREQQDWVKLGDVFRSVCRSNPSLTELNRLSESIAMALLRDCPPSSPLPFCRFVEAVCQGSSIGGLVKSLLGRISVSLMFRYYKTQQWTKGKRLLDTLNASKVNYSTLKGLFTGESDVSRCRVVSMATEVFLSCGGVESALCALRDNEWIVRSPLWQCEEADVQHRRGVLCRLAEGTTQKDMFVETLEVLTKLTDLQDPKVDVSQYNIIFHRHLNACLEKHNLTVASNMVELMFQKKILVDVCLLRFLIHKLGKQNAWQNVRSLYKSALSTGCYPQTQVNKYCRLLPVPCTLSEIEMILAIEMFMVTNASDIQNPGFFPHALQVVLKRKRGPPLGSQNDYHAASRRLLSAAQTANPKLVIKYATVNLSREQVFTLDSLSAYKWLAQNMNWVSKDWPPSDSKPETNVSPQSLSS
ncbi:hypothetical protein AAFF_G00402650 [Aldrovandia affinis]|uniref:Protein TOPAZ1 n=1 Tax=Aldrovandia affinis TaxID=143900 RepID=A0AAD7X0H3_9TELE|nr:hypothetical protein AAFF_G00402650 [Aldrovandia affinis]